MPLPPSRPSPEEWPQWASQLTPSQVITTNAGGVCTLYRVAMPNNGDNPGRLFTCLKVTCSTAEGDLHIVDAVNRLRAVHRLTHPHLNKPIWLLDNGLDNTVYGLFNYYPLGSVEDRLRALGGGRPLSIRQSRVWFSQTVGALSYVHARSIAHRHIKLTSLLIRRVNGSAEGEGEEEEAVLGGFTPTTLVTAYQAGGNIMRKTVCANNLAYRAPEAHPTSVWPYDAKGADMYAMGVCLFMMLNARAPFDERLYDERSPMEYIARQIARDYAWEEAFAGVHYNDNLKHLVHLLLEPKPGMRMTAEYAVGHVALLPP